MPQLRDSGTHPIRRPSHETGLSNRGTDSGLDHGSGQSLSNRTIDCHCETTKKDGSGKIGTSGATGTGSSGHTELTGFDRIFGIETEYGVSVTGVDGTCDAGQVAMTMFQPVVSRARSTNTYLENGSRLYLDVGSHPEYATAEARDPSDALAQDLAGERLMHRLALQAQERLRSTYGPKATIHVYKNNVDSAGHSFGCHENYLVRRFVPLQTIENELLPFLITRQLFTGAGRLTPDGFCITQRADFLDEAVSSATTRARPMVNTRDEPHADPDSYRRLHVIIGDSNRSQFATTMKLATTHLVLCVIEQACRLGVPSGLEVCALADPNAANRAVSKDVTCNTARLELVNENAFRSAMLKSAKSLGDDSVSGSVDDFSGDSAKDAAVSIDGSADAHTGDCAIRSANSSVNGVTALQIQYRYLAVVDDFLDEHGDAVVTSMPSAYRVRDQWAHTLDDLAAGRFNKLASHVDWVAKKRLIDAVQARHGDVPFARLEQIDMDYHDVANGTVYESLIRRGAMTRSVDDDVAERALREPPHNTRAVLRGRFVSEATAAGARYSCDWTHVAVNAPVHREATMIDPFDSTPSEEFTELIDALHS